MRARGPPTLKRTTLAVPRPRAGPLAPRPRLRRAPPRRPRGGLPRRGALLRRRRLPLGPRRGLRARGPPCPRPRGEAPARKPRRELRLRRDGLRRRLRRGLGLRPLHPPPIRRPLRRPKEGPRRPQALGLLRRDVLRVRAARLRRPRRPGEPDHLLPRRRPLPLRPDPDHPSRRRGRLRRRVLRQRLRPEGAGPHRLLAQGRPAPRLRRPLGLLTVARRTGRRLRFGRARGLRRPALLLGHAALDGRR